MAKRKPDDKPPVTLPAKRGKAVCHPTRSNFKDGLCESCVNRELIDKAVTAQQKKHFDNEIEALHHTVEFLEEITQKARRILQENLPGYAAMHFAGATIAAAQGDTRPAEWALTQVKAGKETPVQPPAKTAPESGLKIFIGVRSDAGPSITVGAEHSIIDAETSKT
jgi:hypothetical protein